MNKKTPREAFEELVIPRKELPQLSGRYRVYKDASDYITVEAGSALEALKLCGLPKVHRIERDAIYLTNVLNLQALSNTPAPAAPTVGELELVPVAGATPPEAPAAASDAAPLALDAQAPVADAALSTADVDKLLQG